MYIYAVKAARAMAVRLFNGIAVHYMLRRNYYPVPLPRAAYSDLAPLRPDKFPPGLGQGGFVLLSTHYARNTAPVCRRIR